MVPDGYHYAKLHKSFTESNSMDYFLCYFDLENDDLDAISYCDEHGHTLEITVYGHEGPILDGLHKWRTENAEIRKRIAEAEQRRNVPADARPLQEASSDEGAKQ